MKKIKITEKQASLLGLKNIKEAEESGIKSVSVALGEKIVRIVIAGDNVGKFKDRILQLISRQDPTAKVGFFELTGKIVGNVKDIKVGSIKRDVQALDPTITVQDKPITKSLKEGKNIVKITKEQYNRIFADKLINESDDVKGGVNRVDKSFKKEFAGKGIQNIKPVSEEKFNISKPNKSVPKLGGNVGHREAPIAINEGEDQLKKETLDLIKYLYRKTDELSSFWSQNGLTYDDICDTLLNKKLIVKNDGKYELAKSLGSPQAAIQALESELSGLLKPEQQLEPELETESDYPAGSENDSSAPWNQKDADMTSPITPKESKLKVVGYNREIALLTAPDGSMYVFYYYDIDRNNFAQYASLERTYTGKDEDGDPQYDYDTENFEIDGDVLSHYVNDNLDSLSKGEGLDAYESGDYNLVKVDDQLKSELVDLYDKDKNVLNILQPIAEIESIDLVNQFKDEFKPLPQAQEEPEAKQSRIIAKLGELKAKEKERIAKEKAEIEARQQNDYEIDETQHFIVNDEQEKSIAKYIQSNLAEDPTASSKKLAYNFNMDFDTGYGAQQFDEIIKKYNLKPNLGEMTSASSSGAFTGPLGGAMVKKEMPDVPVVGETTTISAGNYQYDTPGLANIGRNGEFKKGPKTKAQKTTQWAGGEFVKQPDCSKLNNNKSAQGGGCNQGASSLKTVKTGGSINAPSLGENEIYEAISKKTGKSLDEVKKIINNNFTKNLDIYNKTK